MKNNRLYVDIHVLQTVPPSCVNRDDTGAPKTAMYGGAIRARVSSQCWKKAVRDDFKNNGGLPENNLGIRTKNLVQMIATSIRDINPSIDDKTAGQFARNTVNIASKEAKKPIVDDSSKKKKANDEEGGEPESDKSAALFFVTPKQVLAVANLAAKWITEGIKPEKKAVEEALMEKGGIDVALFGRLVTQAPSLNVDACAQVAHSISTHKVSSEYDYFTAVDDLPSEDDSGASHIGGVEFNSSTLYRYATVAVHELHKQIGDDTTEAVKRFVKSFVCSMPTGKQNTFANRTLPDAVFIGMRNDQPINLVGAFEKPVPPSDEGYVAASAKRLVNHAESIYNTFAEKPLLSLVTGDLLAELGEVQPLGKLLDSLADEISRRLSGNGGAQ